MNRLEPFLDQAVETFQALGKDGNPLKDDNRLTAFRTLIEAGAIDRPQAAAVGLVKEAQFDETIAGIAAYHIYRLRSSIAHSRIGEYLLEEEDEAMIAGFGLPLLGEIAVQVFSSTALAELVV